METPNGTVSVSYRKSGDGVKFNIVIPHGAVAVFKYLDNEIALSEGENCFSI